MAATAGLVRESLEAVERQIIFISGEAGIGKTALTEAFLARTAAHAQIRTATAQCVASYREQEPYYPILEALGRLCRGAGQRSDGRVAGEACADLARAISCVSSHLHTAKRCSAKYSARRAGGCCASFVKFWKRYHRGDATAAGARRPALGRLFHRRSYLRVGQTPGAGAIDVAGYLPPG